MIGDGFDLNPFLVAPDLELLARELGLDLPSRGVALEALPANLGREEAFCVEQEEQLFQEAEEESRRLVRLDRDPPTLRPPDGIGIGHRVEEGAGRLGEELGERRGFELDADVSGVIQVGESQGLTPPTSLQRINDPLD